MLIVPVAVPMVPAVFAADIMSVDPMMMVFGPMARDPNHFVVPLPITGAVVVIGPVTDFDSEFLCRNGGRQNDARDRYRGEQKFFRNHASDSHGNG